MGYGDWSVFWPGREHVSKTQHWRARVDLTQQPVAKCAPLLLWCFGNAQAACGQQDVSGTMPERVVPNGCRETRGRHGADLRTLLVQLMLGVHAVRQATRDQDSSSTRVDAGAGLVGVGASPRFSIAGAEFRVWSFCRYTPKSLNQKRLAIR